MRLHTTTWGTGDRLALLVHGITADHRTWRRVAPALAGHGYRVIAVDLRGHGASGRSDGYSVRQHAADLVETLPRGAELAIGHSLGALTLSLAVEELAPRRAVYSDPVWWLPDGPDGFRPELLTRAKGLTREEIRAVNPRWEETDVETELETLALWDTATAAGLGEVVGRDLMPERAVVPSLVPLADPSQLVPAERAELLRRRGFEVRTVPGTGHTIHRDDHDGFLAALDGWI
ncbi:alpha/beta fold hydrolase [Streptomyces clavuligerus]|uniref:alpha/beta fold hydrolase n=1 Tax=Streptomyces clavuligerus TaxID=1901 RepID=UPI00081050D0|nr:alpha/beta fold hydrolase [Streptomyces clavuligerus]ANW21753.1 hydrolase [Streptomyces clavuligerus]AXU16384.1 alpha/beta hydrolase [Streptomyces clavuligerus]MBY6301387.1 alpha/beta fold hydrolase [Streptomyces clavuligerus]QPL61684.1 alpha/beta fold hydrolase [Streptomyces clavuligerus]QPL67719.1 alpha/beta fold hydrolase [Streptomyces clavuligerus]